MAVDRDGNIRGARRLGFLDRPRTARSSLRPASDINDYYSFNLSARSSVAVSATELQQNVNLGLLDSSGRSIVFSRRPGTQSESITRTLEAGLYYVRVALFGTSTSYSLRATATPTPVVPPPGSSPTPSPGGSPSPTPSPGGSPSPTPVPSPTPAIPANLPRITPVPEPGSTLGLAFNTGNVGAGRVYRDTVGGADIVDYYRFTVAQSSQVRVVTGNVTGGSVATTLIFDINGSGSVDSNDVVASGDNITRSLGTGNYFVGVTPSGNNVTYELQLEGTPITGISPAADPFLGLRRATDLGVLNGSSSLRQLVGSVDSADVYKFTLAQQVSDFTALLNTTQATGNVTVSLVYDAGNDGIPDPSSDFIAGNFTSITPGSPGGAALTLNSTLGGGTYYLIVTAGDLVDNTTYDLNLFVSSSNFVNSSYDQSIIGPNIPANITPVTNPGNSIGSAFNAGSLTTNPIYFKQFVGAVDNTDFYSFTVSQQQTVIITYGGTPRPINLRLGVDRDGNGIFNPPEDLNNNGILESEDLNRDGALSPEEDKNNNFILDTEDTNRNGILDTNEVFQPSPAIPLPEGRAVYSPLPPYFDPSAGFRLQEGPVITNAFVTPAPTAIYAVLNPGTYYLEVQVRGIAVDLGDTLVRGGPDNILYDLKMVVDG